MFSISTPSVISNKKIIWLFILFSSLLFCFIDCQVAPNTLLENGGFESSQFFADPPSPNWRLPVGSEGPNRDVRVGDVAHSGNLAVQFGSGTQYDSILQSVNVPNGFYYELSFWVRTLDVEFSLRAFAQFDGQSEQLLVEVNIANIQAAEWTLFSAIITAPRQAAGAMIPLTIRFSGRNEAGYW